MLYAIDHQTVFDFESTPLSVVQRLHLTPLALDHQRLLHWEIDIEGGTLELEADDYHGNRIHLCQHDLASDTMKITCRGQIEVMDKSGIVGAHDSHVPLVLFKNTTALSMPGPRLRQLSREMKVFQEAGHHGDLEVLHELSSRILASIRYIKGKTDITTAAETAMEIGAGVCQDHVHAFLAVARLLGFAARYASGYLMMDEGTVQEASHAWAEVHVDDLGWVGFDISNAISPDDRYIKLATGFDYADVIPVSGIRVGTGEERMSTRIVIAQQ